MTEPKATDLSAIALATAETPSGAAATAPLPPAGVWLAHWILLAASCNIAGWGLSLIRSVTPVGLFISIPLVWALLALLVRLPLPRFALPSIVRNIRQRRWLPLSFLLIALLALLGGLLHPPNNYDALNYRMPRLAYWLMERRWEWIPANFDILNTRSAGFEWLMAPVIALSRSDSPLFLINLICFLFLPGLAFGIFHGMGVAGRVARAWMWLLPSGYCFALQAGSIGNDLPAAMFAMAAFDFGFRWRKSGSFTCFALAVFSAGLMTAIKPTTLPLMLPFTVLFIGMWKPLVARPARSMILAGLAALASFLPSAIINHRQCGDWTGAAAENPSWGPVEPLQGIVVNLINAPIQNLAPPVFPLAGLWNRWFPSLFPESFMASLAKSFEGSAARFGLSDIQGEEWAGIGLGITALWLGSIISAIIIRKRQTPRSADTSPSARGRQAVILALLFGTALLAYFAKTGMNTVARHIAPYYPFLLAIPLIAPAHSALVRSKLWNLAAMAAVASTMVMMVITPSRPLWPANTVLPALAASHPTPALVRAADGYHTYSQRADVLGILRDALPPDARTVGWVSFAAGPELPLWKPYLQRKVRHVRPGDSLETLLKQGIRHVVLNTKYFEDNMGHTPEQWLDRNHATILKRESIRVVVKEPASEWWVVELPAAR